MKDNSPSVTFDNNLFSPISSPGDYTSSPVINEAIKIRNYIKNGRVEAFVSEASLGLDALNHEDRIDKFFREWATKSFGIELPKPEPIRVQIVQSGLSLGFKVLRVPRIALGAFFNINKDSWASDELINIKERQKRYSLFVRYWQDATGEHIGPQNLRDIGADLAQRHQLSTVGVLQLPGMSSPEQVIWEQGLVAEFDNPKKFISAKKFARYIREYIAEWSDLDILASHYSYDIDYFCTADQSRTTGSKGILHSSFNSDLKSNWGVKLISASDLIKIVGL